MSPRTFTLTFLGDIMLARLIDQLLPNSTNTPTDAHNAEVLKSKNPSLAEYTPSSPWGTTLPLLHSTDLLTINLETSATATSQAWPDKKYNYRTHPANIPDVLHLARVDYASLANNHILDFCEEGMIETIWTLKQSKISFAGAGESIDEAFKPATLWLPNPRRTHTGMQQNHTGHDDEHERTSTPSPNYAVHVYSASDHPAEWKNVPTFHFIDYSPATRTRVKRLLTQSSTIRPDTPSGSSENSSSESRSPALKIFSVHWGSNYKWTPSDEIQSFAHFLIDECGVDIAHGHSSHHVQGVEIYKGKVIIYGCGDFVDDYVFRKEFRNDLGAVWRVIVSEVQGQNQSLKLDRLEIFPTRNKGFRACMLDSKNRDHGWVREKIRELSLGFGSDCRDKLGVDGQIIFDIS